MEIRKAIINDVQQVAKLFAEYRVFYGQDYDLDKAANFLTERLENNDSIIFVAAESGVVIGFAQLYPSFTSIGMQKILILNDLFVDEKHRKKGIAQMLINYVLMYSKETGRKKVTLSTAYTNKKAQRLYEKLGFQKTEFYHYEKGTL